MGWVEFAMAKKRVSDPLFETGRKAAEELVEISQDVYHPGVP